MRLLVCLFLFVCPLAIAAQPDTTAPTLHQFNAKRIALSKGGMQVLGGWAVVNIASGVVLRYQTTGTARAFHTMNAGWNLVNLGIATVSYIGLSNQEPGHFTWQESVKAQYNMQKILLFNAGLDIGYMIGGLYLRERAYRSDRPDIMRGWGNSLVLQGGFLFLFDTIMAYLHSRHNSTLDGLLRGVQLRAGSDGIGLLYRW